MTQSPAAIGEPPGGIARFLVGYTLVQVLLIKIMDESGHANTPAHPERLHPGK